MPTVATKAVFLTTVVDAWEGQTVAVMDMMGAFMQVNMEMVDKLLEINHKIFSPYVVKEKGVHVMYVELLKAVYGTLCKAFLGTFAVQVD